MERFEGQVLNDNSGSMASPILLEPVLVHVKVTDGIKEQKKKIL